jgi:hypothetical protein
MKNGAKMIPKSENACLGWILKEAETIEISDINGMFPNR